MVKGHGSIKLTVSSSC